MPAKPVFAPLVEEQYLYRWHETYVIWPYN